MPTHSIRDKSRDEQMQKSHALNSTSPRVWSVSYKGIASLGKEKSRLALRGSEGRGGTLLLNHAATAEHGCPPAASEAKSNYL